MTDFVPTDFKPTFAEVKAEDKADAKAADAKVEWEAKAKVEVKADDAKEVKRKEKADCLEKAQAIIKEYDGMESNIPINHEYWGLMNRYRGL